MVRFAILVSVFIPLAGCEANAPTTKPQQDPSKPPAAAVQPVEKIELAPIGKSVPPLDGGKLSAAMPEGWSFLPRSNDYLFAAYLDDKTGVPRLVLKAEDVADLPTTNSSESAQALKDHLLGEIEKDAKVDVIELEGRYFIRYEKLMKFRASAARGVYLETVEQGRKYQVSLMCYKEDKAKYLPALYRFAASLEFVPSTEEDDSTATDTPEESEEPKADEPTAHDESNEDSEE